jgi:thiamine kinase-like enzyme
LVSRKDIMKIPEAKTEAVARALRDAFGGADMDNIQMMTEGLSKALVFRIAVRGNPYLLRITTNTNAAAGPGQGDQTNHFAAMKIASDAGIGPRVWYTSIEDGISITDFVAAQPFPRTEALALLPATLQKLHALPPFSSERVVNFLDVMDKIVQRFQAAEILPASEAAQLFEFYAQVKQAYPRDGSETVSSHNDLRPENILYDGHRAWLVDWEAAFLNDRYLDLAVVANFVVTNPAEEETYLRTYFGEPASEYRRARLYLMRQLLHLFYPAFIMTLSCKGRSIDSIANAPDLRNFLERIWAGEINLADDEAKLDYAKAHMSDALQNHRTPRFREALRIVSATQ